MLRYTTLAVTAVAFVIAGTVALHAELVPPEAKSLDQLYGTMLHKAKWDRTAIEVCWENPEAASKAEFMTLTKQAVAETWEANSPVRFKGWAKCVDKKDPGLHIRISDDQPHTVAVGNKLDQRPDGMFLNFTFLHWRQRCQKDLDFCIKAVAVHEFGHALGFTHEQKKENVPAECSSEPNDIVGDYLVTKYDLSSIMSLCNEKWNGSGKLSNLDIGALQKIYGASPS
jgi:hypothetical protein